jgi:hypothetical protein
MSNKTPIAPAFGNGNIALVLSERSSAHWALPNAVKASGSSALRGDLTQADGRLLTAAHYSA